MESCSTLFNARMRVYETLILIWMEFCSTLMYGVNKAHESLQGESGWSFVQLSDRAGSKRLIIWSLNSHTDLFNSHDAGQTRMRVEQGNRSSIVQLS